MSLPRYDAKDMGDGTLEIVGSELDGLRVPVLSIEGLGALSGFPGLRWADERQWCRHAHEGRRPETCSMFGVDDHAPGGFCKLNGYSIEAWGLEAALAMRTPCVFDESQDAPIWIKVERWRTQEFPLGCLNLEQINSKSG